MANPLTIFARVLAAAAGGAKGIGTSGKKAISGVLSQIARVATPGQKREIKALQTKVLGAQARRLTEEQQRRDAVREQREKQEKQQLVMHSVQSSNVHSFGYREEDQTLFVRYLGGSGQKRQGPGPLYAYYHVPVKVYEKFRAASSAGSFVWDELRIRGSIFGHQYDYALVGTTDGYVPRKATGFGFNPRQLLKGGQVIRSALPGTGKFKGKR